MFTADAEIAEPETGARIEARITDISQRGCYVDSPRSFPLGTAVRVNVKKAGDSFVAPARVVSSSEKGMGMAFGEIANEQHEIMFQADGVQTISQKQIIVLLEPVPVPNC